MMKTALLIFLFTPLAFAGNRVGNGGNVIACPDKVELLDFYETENKTSVTGSEYKKIIEGRLEILKRLAPKLADQYQRRSKSIGGELGFKEGVALTLAGDSLHAYAPADETCKFKQIAIRQDIPAGSKRFVIDKVLWDKLSATHQAGLIMHEIIYEHFVKLGAEDSRKARLFNAYLFSPEIEKVSTGKFWLVMKDLEVAIYP